MRTKSTYTLTTPKDMSKTIVQITWICEDIKEQTTIRGGTEFEFYEAIATNGIVIFASKHNLRQHLVNVEILVKYIRN